MSKSTSSFMNRSRYKSVISGKTEKAWTVMRSLKRFCIFCTTSTTSEQRLAKIKKQCPNLNAKQASDLSDSLKQGGLVKVDANNNPIGQPVPAPHVGDATNTLSDPSNGAIRAIGGRPIVYEVCETSVSKEIEFVPPSHSETVANRADEFDDARVVSAQPKKAAPKPTVAKQPAKKATTERETMSAEQNAQNKKDEGGFKIGSELHGAVPQDATPVSTEGTNSVDPKDKKPMERGAGFGDPIENKLVETAAINAVKKRYENDGWNVHSVERDRCGFDLECHRKGVVENVEVKGVRATEQCFIITTGEVEQAKKNSNFVLMVVTSAMSASPILTRYSGAEFCRRFNLSPIQYRATPRS